MSIDQLLPCANLDLLIYVITVLQRGLNPGLESLDPPFLGGHAQLSIEGDVFFRPSYEKPQETPSRRLGFVVASTYPRQSLRSWWGLPIS